MFCVCSCDKLFVTTCDMTHWDVSTYLHLLWLRQLGCLVWVIERRCVTNFRGDEVFLCLYALGANACCCGVTLHSQKLYKWFQVTSLVLYINFLKLHIQLEKNGFSKNSILVKKLLVTYVVNYALWTPKRLLAWSVKRSLVLKGVIYEVKSDAKKVMHALVFSWCVIMILIRENRFSCCLRQFCKFNALHDDHSAVIY